MFDRHSARPVHRRPDSMKSIDARVIARAASAYRPAQSACRSKSLTTCAVLHVSQFAGRASIEASQDRTGFGYIVICPENRCNEKIDAYGRICAAARALGGDEAESRLVAKG